MRHKGYAPTSKVAKALDVCEATVRNWAKKALCGDDSKLTDVKQNKLTGRIYISLIDVDRLKRS